MSYQLGIDLGTTYTAAAICRGTEQAPAGADVVTLGTRSATVASVLYLADDGSILVGEAAERRALTDPDRVVREYKRRIGDDVPLMIAGRPHQAHELAARMVRWVVDQVSEREGGPPRRISVTHPAAWGQHKKDLLAGALRTVGLTVTFLAEPQAAAVSYASAERVEAGSTIAVYDLGGGTFDAAVVRKTGGGGFELLGQPEGIERLGGVDFDEVVFGHVREGLGSAVDDLDADDPDVLSAVARLRRECVEAKEALSSDTEATIPVLLPDLRTQARLTRGEFEAMIRSALEETVDALRRAVGSAGLTPNDLTAVLLVGGSSRIPLVSQLVSDGLGRPVAVDADPKTAIALGAALAISPQQHQRPAGGMVLGPGRVPQPGNQTGPRPVTQSGPRPGVGAGMAGAGLAGAGFAGSQSQPAVPSSGPLGQRPGGPPRPSGPPSAPPQSRPAAAFAAPPRPAVDYQRPDYADPQQAHDGYAEPGRNRQTGLLIGVGGVVAIVAIVAAIFLWPKSDATDTTGSSTDLSTADTSTPATTTPKTTTPKTTPKTTPRTTPRATTPAPSTTTGTTSGTTTGGTTTGGTTTGGTTGGTTTGGTTGGSTGTTTGSTGGTTGATTGTSSGASTGTSSTSGSSTGTTSTSGVTGTTGGTASGPATTGSSAGAATGTSSGSGTAASTTGGTGSGATTSSAGTVGGAAQAPSSGGSDAVNRPVSRPHGPSIATTNPL